MNDEQRFIDTGFWLALIDPGDQYHGRALAISRTTTGRFLTTEAVLVEIGNALARERWRSRAAALLAEIYATPTIEVVPVSSDLLRGALDLYGARTDKEWGLTDCISFVVMQERGITEALAADQHFVQAGFRALLRER